MQDTKKHYSGYNCIRSGGMKIMKTMEDEFNDKLAEKQAKIDELTVKNAELEQLVADLASLQLEVLMNG